MLPGTHVDTLTPSLCLTPRGGIRPGANQPVDEARTQDLVTPLPLL